MKLLALIALCLIPVFAEVSCPHRCSYSLCTYAYDHSIIHGVQSTILRAPSTVALPFICNSEGDPIRRPISGEALIYAASTFTPISQFRPSGLHPRFTRRHFTSAPVNFPKYPIMRGLKRKNSRGNQESYLNGLCVYMPIGASTRPTEGMASIDSGKCVQFVTKVPKLLVQFSWNSADDFDIFLREPNGNVINLFRRSSASGAEMSEDLNGGSCSPVGGGWEEIVWSQDAAPLSGLYRMRMEQNVVCDTNPTEWKLKVTLNGKEIVSEKGVSRSKYPTVVRKLGFTIWTT